MMPPEPQARAKIDALLIAAGRVVQDRRDFNRTASLGVAVRAFQLPAGPCDYRLLVDGKAVGGIEAKQSGVTLSGVAEQSDTHMMELPEHLAHWDTHWLFGYESTGDETFFPRYRRSATLPLASFCFP
jgi:type I restriction enzyme, R subunit